MKRPELFKRPATSEDSKRRRQINRFRTLARKTIYLLEFDWLYDIEDYLEEYKTLKERKKNNLEKMINEQYSIALGYDIE